MRLLRAVVAGACVVAVGATVTASAGAAPRMVVVLQMNLCNSGIAGCYTGRAVQQAAALIVREAPHVVTLNEICEDDVTVLAKAVQHRIVAFQPVPDRRTGQATMCSDGRPFGVGLMLRESSPIRTVAQPGVHPVQDPSDPEQRVWLCLTVPGRFAACTTHLAINGTIAAAQCAHLLGTVVPALGIPTIVSGDFNLRADSMRTCVPAQHASRGDDGLQHVVTTAGLTIGTGKRIDMAGATDHPALLVTVRQDRPRR